MGPGSALFVDDDDDDDDDDEDGDDDDDGDARRVRGGLGHPYGSMPFYSTPSQLDPLFGSNILRNSVEEVLQLVRGLLIVL